ncbi:DNA-directed RNA polymerase I subunit RPA2, putative [Entamoeba invadens IP1]|uniref:DNA-directed RNA polymerase subunit beta n=1 Tax=Entamoeba invadens IP1 TaxID=370355 RepID=A0A0A1U5H7_ENTIV|nr:DNA-directed RNA polymerase I subunit RPA2, putative [Entamoeba invadens IP1]ELP89482.1 DNA-directed RNA polymerase I subunit RPA2, putative [Entamoeba invadens IP1]|eukprot:XP_004256253.1 DNA-directed RNA polymerase I subunit RPA2, putative [Entamoeba invadens IP1]
MDSNTVSPNLLELTRAHVESFDYFLDEGKNAILKTIPPMHIIDPEKNEIMTVSIKTITIDKPMFNGKPLYPFMCRTAGLSYLGALHIVFSVIQNGIENVFNVNAGEIPMMLCSDNCWLGTDFRTPQDRIDIREDPHEIGGYFIIHGVEKYLRMILYAKPNHPIAVARPSWEGKGAHFTKYGVMIRCMRNDITTLTNTMHYLDNGKVCVRFIYRKQEFFIPIILLLRVYTGMSDREIFELVTMGNKENSNLVNAAELLVRRESGSILNTLNTTEQILAFIGQKFRVVMVTGAELTDAQAGKYILDEFVFVHLDSYAQKADLSIFMLQKLFAFVNGEIDEESVDTPMTQSILLAGHLYQTVFKDELNSCLMRIRMMVLKDWHNERKRSKLTEKGVQSRIIESGANGLSKRMQTFIATGNFAPTGTNDLQQENGFSITAERLNHSRFSSHFVSVHRGAFYTTMKTTAIRKLVPESWGFMCPVHTPDGAPCGLLNHLACSCRINARFHPLPDETTIRLCTQLGMISSQFMTLPSIYIPVLMNGKVIGKVAPHDINAFVQKLRYERAMSNPMLPNTLEIGYCDGYLHDGYHALYLNDMPGQMVRPIRHRLTGKTVYIGPYEQVFLDIKCGNAIEGMDKSEYEEISEMNSLSLLATTIPFCHMNQSPRNMYQCQMAKQTMGFPMMAYKYRSDSKLLLLHYPQRSLCQCTLMEPFGFNELPTGTNAVVAVISYTGYDMEDALIIKKTSIERGFGHGSQYKAYKIDLTKEQTQMISGLNPKGELYDEHLDFDGLPRPGEIFENSPIYSEIDKITGVVKTKKLMGEKGYIESVTIVGNDKKEAGQQQAVVRVRYNRTPVIGDKFSSRHGQKGTLSVHYAEKDMPFTESGMTPDILINPHAFPSRMTIGMLIESMASKVGALKGEYQDGTPFKFDEQNRAVEYFGKQLLKYGYNYYGSEPMYSGITGTEMQTDIYIGVVYYQRLVHQVKDKYQVRSTGPVNPLTQQPVKGRKRGGGIRLGEMERDSLLGHGTAALVEDRFLQCSDKSYHYVCKKCGSMVSIYKNTELDRMVCASCGQNSAIKKIQVPYVLRYLASELGAMNVRLRLKTAN